jgi:hypothetical protein
VRLRRTQYGFERATRPIDDREVHARGQRRFGERRDAFSPTSREPDAWGHKRDQYTVEPLAEQRRRSLHMKHSAPDRAEALGEQVLVHSKRRQHHTLLGSTFADELVILSNPIA